MSSFEGGVGRFGWLGIGLIPGKLDLRELGWELVPPPEDLAVAMVPLLLPDLTRAVAIRSQRVRAAVIVTDIADSQTRAHLLSLRFGEAVPPGLTLGELAQRAQRLSTALAALPRRLSHGPLLLDLLHREAWVGQRRLGLHPREFGLLWRLTETPGVPVSPGALLHDVWHLPDRPETNSLAVHVCRLRAKLAGAGLPQVLRTCAAGYLIVGDRGSAAEPAPEEPPIAATNRVAMPATSR